VKASKDFYIAFRLVRVVKKGTTLNVTQLREREGPHDKYEPLVVKLERQLRQSASEKDYITDAQALLVKLIELF
jgi:hypothetical protein